MEQKLPPRKQGGKKPQKKPIGRVQRILIVGGFLGIALFGLIGMSCTPTIADLFFASLLKSDTIYTDGYSESKWKSLRRGMTSEQVEATMGTPFSKSMNPFADKGGRQEIWMYSRSTGGISYWKRNVIIEGGKVEGFEGEFDVH